MSKKLNTNFTVLAPKPIDSRMFVATYADLNGIPVKYNHMVVHVEDTDKDYKYYASVPEWVEVTLPVVTGSATWGFITGDITNQTDLITYLITNFADIDHTHPQLPPLAHTHLEVDITDLDKYTQAEVDALVANRGGYSTGVIAGGNITINADPTKFDISSGNFMYNELALQDPFVEPIIHNVDFTAWTAVTPTFLATHPATYVGITYNPGTLTYSLAQSSVPFSSASRRTVALLGVILHADNVNINRIINYKDTPVRLGSQLGDLMRSVGALNLSGNKITANGANLSINKSVGSIFQLGINFAADANTPHTKTTNALVAPIFTYSDQLSVEQTASANVNPSSYDNAGTLTAVTAGYWTIQRFYLLGDNYVRAQFGQTEYATKDAAVSVMESEPFVVDSVNLYNGILRAYLVVQQGATDLSNTAEAEFFEVSKFGWAVQKLENIESDKHYEHTQGSASASWVIPHNLNKKPSVTIQDGSGNNIEGQITYTDANNLTVDFNTAFSGVAYLN